MHCGRGPSSRQLLCVYGPGEMVYVMGIMEAGQWEQCCHRKQVTYQFPEPPSATSLGLLRFVFKHFRCRIFVTASECGFSFIQGPPNWSELGFLKEYDQSFPPGLCLFRRRGITD